MRQTKIIATVGPASDSDAVLDDLIAAGADIFRLNFSHGTHQTHGATFARIRKAAQRARREVAILQDLGGPKIRTGQLEGGRPVLLIRGESVTIGIGDFHGTAERISTTYAALARGARPGDRLLLSDGTIELSVERVDGTDIVTTVIEGGTLGQHKGINAPGVELPDLALTQKDVEDLKFGLTLGVDLVALSFVQNAEDVKAARAVMNKAGSQVPLIAKIERPKAVENLQEILDCVDAVMIARGDLGLEMPLERVPRAQKEITWKARARKIPVILATQVLESMTTEGRPTRAEVSDAANAVDDGVDVIMLAGETASGAYPARSVQTLDRIIRDAESSFPSASAPVYHSGGTRNHVDAICEAAVTLAEHGGAQAIIAVTRGGATARLLSALRPGVPILAITDREEMARSLSLNWGVFPVTALLVDNVDSVGTFVGKHLVERGLITEGAIVVLVSIHHDRGRLDANYLKIQRL